MAAQRRNHQRQDGAEGARAAGELKYREGSVFGNPWLRLLRREVEALVKKKHGEGYLEEQRTTAELAHINGEQPLRIPLVVVPEHASPAIAAAE